MLESAQKLLNLGCLWNSFVMVGKVQTFLQLFERTAGSFGTLAETAKIGALYAWIDETNFSTEVLQKCDEELLVLRVGKVGWSDWGEPQRVLGTLKPLGLKTEWMAHC